MTPQEQQAQQFRCAAYILENNSPWEFQLPTGEWKTSDQHILRIVASGLTIRVKETPTLIPLEAFDIPPGSVISVRPELTWFAILWLGSTSLELLLSGRQIQSLLFETLLKDNWLINRSIPRLGKWDPTAWEPCSKPQ
jgi:hypothetical protein